MVSQQDILSSKDYFLDIESYLDLACNVYMKDAKGIYRECNLHQAKNFGAAVPCDIIGKSDTDLHPYPRETQLCAANDLEVLKTERPKIVIEPCTFVDKTTVSLLSYKIPCRNKQGKVIGVFGTSIPLNSLERFAPHMPLPILSDEIDPLKHETQSIGETKISKRERECLDCLVRGMTAKEIARVLNLSPRTIEFYIENMKKKLGCSNRIKLIAKAFDILK